MKEITLLQPGKIVFGTGCIDKFCDDYLSMGHKRLFLLTVPVIRPMLADAIQKLESNGVSIEIYENIMQEPTVADFKTTLNAAREFKADSVIGVGGGSVLDVAKLVATLVNSNQQVEDLFGIGFVKERGRWFACIPTTAGTGSEANPYAVMTLPDGEQKKTLKYPFTYPRLALVDPKYTYSLGYEYTVSTALDAFAHAIESFLSPSSTLFSEQFALFSAKNIYDVLKGKPSSFSESSREKLAYASCAAGAAISVTGTGFPHPLGYSLTLLRGIPHGKACAVFEGHYISLNSKTKQGQERLDAFFAHLGTNANELSSLLFELADVKISLTEDEIIKFVDLIKGAGNYVNSPYILTDDEKYDIYRDLFSNN